MNTRIAAVPDDGSERPDRTEIRNAEFLLSQALRALTDAAPGFAGGEQDAQAARVQLSIASRYLAEGVTWIKAGDTRAVLERLSIEIERAVVAVAGTADERARATLASLQDQVHALMCRVAQLG
jgi:hypothetical protein